MSSELDPIFESFPDIYALYSDLVSQGYTLEPGVSWRRNKRESLEAVAMSFRRDGEIVRISQELNLKTKDFSELFYESHHR